MRIEVDTSGLDRLQRRLEALTEPHSVPLTEILTTSFLRRYTDFSSADEMFERSGFKVESPDDFENIPDAEWDQFITQHTRFSNWSDMLQAAGTEYVKHQLGL
jgi:hypothetical protein